MGDHDRFARGLRELGKGYVSDPDWQAKVFARAARAQRRHRIVVLLLVVAALVLVVFALAGCQETPAPIAHGHCEPFAYEHCDWRWSHYYRSKAYCSMQLVDDGSALRCEYEGRRYLCTRTGRRFCVADLTDPVEFKRWMPEVRR